MSLEEIPSLPQRNIDGQIYKMSRYWKGEPAEYFYRLIELFDAKKLFDNDSNLRYVALSDSAKNPKDLETIFKRFVEEELVVPIKK
jgi:hypothetical protein